MIVEHIEKKTIITQEKVTIPVLVSKLDSIYNECLNNNIIVNLFSLSDLKPEQLNEFLLLSKKHKNAKHSFVIVARKIDIDKVSEQLSVVPTLQEAHDFIAMEEIERDLGF